MKNSFLYFIICVSLTLGLVSCENNFENPNAATEDQVFASREGIFAAAVGLQQLYSTIGIQWIVETPAITTREGGITTTLQTMIELEDGGTALPNFNSNVQGLWSTMLRVIEIAEDIEANAGNIDLDPGTQSGLVAHAKLFKALAIGSLAQNYEQVVVETNNDNDATFVTRIQGFEIAITLLTEAAAQISGTTPSQEFIDGILGNIDLANTIAAYTARYNLFAGNYDAAIAAANTVDLTSTSTFEYDTQNQNPIWARIIQNNAPNFKPRDNFGLPAEFVFNPADGRLGFYLIALDDTNQNGLPIEDVAGFFNEITEPIPVYLPDEMNLIIAEANLRLGSPNLTAATAALNEVLTDTDDPFGVNANIAAYAGDNTVEALLNEVYRNRRAELLFTGMSLEDSRRFGRPQPSGAAMDYAEERNRNFYPYPDLERNSNPNTPPDPSI